MMIHGADGDVMAPREYLPATRHGYGYDERPSLVLTDTDISPAFAAAEPSPVMVGASRLYKRLTFLIKTVLVIGLLGFYPYLMIGGSAIDDSPVEFASGHGWDAGRAGVSVMLIAREIEGTGWVADKPVWHPQSRLTALPAWQTAKIAALAEHTELMAVSTGRDEDLAAAARLLDPDDDGYGRARLTAAAEAFARYDGRVEKGLATIPIGADMLVAELKLATEWGTASRTELARLANKTDGWPASKHAIEGYYTAKARAHVAYELLAVAIRSNEPHLQEAGLMDIAADALTAWQRAGTQKPLFVSNLSGDSLFLPSHLASMAFYIEEAVTATTVLVVELEIYEPSPVATDTDIAMMVTSP